MVPNIIDPNIPDLIQEQNVKPVIILSRGRRSRNNNNTAASSMKQEIQPSDLKLGHQPGLI